MAAGLSPGDRVGPYVALFALGKGGMGEVWASLPFGASPDSVPFGASPDSVPFGASPDSVREPIALKILHRDRAGTDDALMFHDEARAAMALRHPAIVPTYEIGEDQGRHYIAMALVRGPSLSALLQRVVVAGDRLDPALIAHLGISVGRALEHAWGQASLRGQPLRLIHRDVSPHNILLDQKGRVRLTDFGVARTSIQEHQSRVGTVRGKPSYMAPEQVSGGTLDNRTDVFALGIVLYECAALRRLFGRKSALKSMDAVLRHPPPPLREAAPDLPRGLAETIERALRKRPSERFQSAAEMVHALQAAVRDLQGQPEQSLRRKIGRHFEAGAFDAESRIEAALSVARAQAEAEALEAPTRVWPVALGADPLAPEALDEVRTVYRPASAVMPEPRVLRPREPSAFSGLPPGPSFEGRPESRPSVDTRPSFSWASAVGTGALRGVTLTGTQVPGRATALLWLAAAMVVGVALTAAAARWVHREPVPAPTRTVPRSAAPPSRARPAVHPTANAVAPASAAAEPPRPRDVPSPTPSPRPAPARVSTPPSRAPPPPRPAPQAPQAPNRPPTYEEVRRLVSRVRAIDPAVGGEMLATLIEAGQDNPELHRRLVDRARAFLAERGTE